MEVEAAPEIENRRKERPNRRKGEGESLPSYNPAVQPQRLTMLESQNQIMKRDLRPNRHRSSPSHPKQVRIPRPLKSRHLSGHRRVNRDALLLDEAGLGATNIPKTGI